MTCARLPPGLVRRAMRLSTESSGMIARVAAKAVNVNGDEAVEVETDVITHTKNGTLSQ